MIDSVVIGALLFSAVMGLFIYLGNKPKPPKKPKRIVLPKLKNKGPR